MSDKNYYPDYIGEPRFGNADEPRNVVTEKTCYQKRFGVTPTTTANLRFNDSREGGLLPLMRSEHVMEYTEVNGRPATAVERGHAPPPGQNRMGA